MKRLFYPSPFREFIVVIALLLLGNQLVLGEGSKDFWDYPGFRLFYLIAPTGNISNEQQTKVYAAEGEFINVGASHVNIRGGFIQVYRPDGSLHSTFDGINGQAIINNHIEELAGPTGGGTTNGDGYTPGVIQVQAGEAGVWTVVLDYPPENESASLFTNINNGTPWDRNVDQPTNGRVCLAWDITITQAAAGNQGGTAVEGRVYSNEYRSMVSSNGNTTSPTFYILTRSGFQYQVDFMESDPFGFPIFSNSRGIVDGNRNATYSSWNQSQVSRSNDPDSWQANSNYLYEPQAEDNGLLWNNKVFFNTPDPNMPTQAIVTDIFRNNTHTTWLFNQVPNQNEGQNTFNFSGSTDATMIVGQGGNFVYTSQVPGLAQLRLDLNNNGSFDDPVDRIIEAEAILGEGNVIFWDGKDGQGADIPVNPSFQFNYDLSVRGGEVHILMDDIENNLGGVTFTRLNGVNSPNSEFFYDHTNVDGPVSGGGTPGNALPTTIPYVYTNNAGNQRILDFWTFVQANNFGSGSITIAIIPPGGPIMDNDGDGIPDVDDIDDDNDGISDAAELAVAGNNGDTDGDGIPDIFDLDSDNDGISDLVEAGHGQADTNGDGVIDGDNFGANGLHNSLETSDDFSAVINYVPADPDGDNVPDHIDLDSDNDGLLDVVEANYGGFDSNNDGRIDDGNGNIPVVDGNGLVSVISPTVTGVGIPFPPDTDGDGVPDWHDLDSDNDGIHDVVENLNIDSDNDGRIGTGIPVVNADGIVITDGTGAGIIYQPNLINTDGTGEPDYRDLDSDGDALLDTQEAGLPDGDNNGLLGTGIPTVDVNGVPTATDGNGNTVTSISNPRDTDGNGTPDFQQIDVPIVCDGVPILTSPSNSVCAGDNIILNVTDLGVGTNYEWFRNGVSLGSTSDPFFNVVVDASDYTVVATESGCPGVTSNVLAITVTPIPTVAIGVSGDLCSGNNIQLTATNLGAGATYSWFRNGVFITSTTEPLLNIPDANADNNGNYSVSATQNGCEGPVSQETPVTVGQGNNVTIGGTSGEICSGEAASLTATDLGAGTNYEWFRNGVSLGSTSEPSFSLGIVTEATSGDYTVVTTKDGCVSTSSNTSTITVSSTTQIQSNLIIDNPVLCEGENFIIRANEAIGNVTYRWFLDGEPFGTTFRPQTVVQGVTLGNSGSYSVEVTLEGCSSVISSSVEVTVIPRVALSLTATRTNLCEGETFQLDVQSNEPGVSYDWLLDGTVVSSTSTPTLTIGPVTTANAGTYTVTPRNTQCTGVNSNAIIISVTDLPNGGNITAANTDLCVGETLALSSTDFGAGTTYNWFLDGVLVSSTSAPSYSVGSAANTAGTYTMIPTRNGCEGTPSNAVSVTVGENIETPVLSVATTEICAGDNLVLNASGVGGTPNYEWFRDGISLGSTSDPFFPVQEVRSGSYTVAVSGGTCGGGTSNAIAVNVLDTPSGGAISTTNPSLCEGETISLSSTNLGDGVTYNWYLNGDLVSSTDVPIYEVGATPATEGTYTMIPAIGICPGPTSAALQISVGQATAAPTITAPSTSLCDNEALVLNASGVGGEATYEWFRGDESLGTTNEPTFMIDAPVSGNYTVSTTGGDCGDGTSDPLAITVSETPPAITFDQESLSFCAGTTATISFSGVGEGVTYNWLRGGQLVATTSEPSYEFVASEETAGDYRVIAVNGDCQSDPSSIQVSVESSGEPPVLSVNNSTICPGSSIVLSTVAAGATTYEWLRNGTSLGTTEEPTFTVENAVAGEYTVTATGADCGGGTSEPILLIVNELPDAIAMILPTPAVDCGVTTAAIQAETPTGGVGRWSSSDPNVVFADPTSPMTMVSGLGGASTVTWTLSDPVCGDFSSDSATINVTSGTALAADDSYTVAFRGTLTGQNIGVNDEAEGPSYTIIANPANGTAEIGADGSIQYTPEASFFGTDQLEYEVCNTACPNPVCDRAIVTFSVEDDPSCEIPDVITPNNDGFNDQLRIPCAATNAIGLKIFNRWGDVVYETDRYNNDWMGTHDGNPLPPGPYYYLLTEPGSDDKRSGCISIYR